MRIDQTHDHSEEERSWITHDVCFIKLVEQFEPGFAETLWIACRSKISLLDGRLIHIG